MKLPLDSIKQDLLGGSPFTLLCCPGFEERSVLFPETLNGAGIHPINFRMVGDGLIAFDSLQETVVVEQRERVYICTPLHRLDASDQWKKVWTVVRDMSGSVVIDATSFSREALGMLLFALAIVVKKIDSVKVVYASPREYIQPLSEGVIGSRTIIGYAGRFEAERSRYFIGLVGFEEPRMLEAISSVEPEFISLGNEKHGTETFEGFTAISEKTLERLRFRLGSYEIDHFEMNAQDLFETKSQVESLVVGHPNTNIVLSAMNTKTSFIGVSLAALQNRSLRLMYTVPCRYSVEYSIGVGNTFLFDITEELRAANVE